MIFNTNKMKLKLILIILAVFTGFISHEQNTILFQENFESGGSSFFQNFPGVGTNTGTNEWIVNNNFTGGGTGYPNTMSEDSTYAGTISYAPYSNYMHIYDASSVYTDCLYNPVNQSDRFAYTWDGTCTFTYDNVTVNFFYLCEGSPTAYGTVYYSREYGPWVQCGALQYNNKYKWQYASITNPAFNDISNLRIGFRWQNNAGSGTDTSGFAIDDFSIVGTFDTVAYPPPHITTTFSPDTICADGGGSANVTFTLSDTLCYGTYSIDMIDSTNTVVAGWSADGYGSLVNGPFNLVIPTNIPGGHCYRWVVSRTSPPTVNGYISGCFFIENCPHSITTLQPSATLDSQAVCAGSTILVPFFSSGTYGNTNVYYAELSDSAGNFTSYDTVGPLLSNQAYPASAGTPGTVLGGIPTNVPSGCHYYIRVVSNSPALAGVPWGPFCIQHCSINGPPGGGGGGGGNSGNPVVIHACIKSCYKNPGGYDYNLAYSLNSSSSVTFSPGNRFEVELLNTQTLAPVDTSVFGAVVSTTSGIITLHVPCADSLCNLNLLNPFSGGPNYFIRLIATSSTPPDSNLGPLMYLQIGYPNDSLSLQPATPNTYCLNGSTPTFYAYPFNFCTEDWFSPVTSYTWYEDNTLIPNVTGEGIAFTYPVGTYTIQVKEENNGCYGPLDTLIFNVEGDPSVSMSGPVKICVGDTGTYNVPFTNNTIYQWSTSNSSHVVIVDTANNLLKVKFNTVGVFTVNVTAIDSCGFAPGLKRVSVIAQPAPTVTASTELCKGSSLPLDATGATGTGGYIWSPTTYLSCTTCASPTATPPSTIQYTVAVSNGFCSVNDSVKIVVNAVPTDVACCNQTITEGQSAEISLAPGSTKETYSWLPAASLSCNTCTHPVATPSVTTTYTLTVHDTTDNCDRIDSVTITVKENCGSIFVPTAFSPNGDGQNDMLYIKAQCLVSLDFIIFDRWGNKVFETNNVNDGWDGKYNGVPMNTGTYVYYISALTNETPAQIISKKGNITLIR